MPKATLGIHLGHHAACAVVADGTTLAALQLERLSRRKHDGCWRLSRRLPIRACLEAAGLVIDDLNAIVTCFQGGSPGGVGLGSSIVEDDFDLFDPFDPRHFVISHHLAHAHSGFGASGFDDCAIFVSDLGGSSTLDGRDFAEPFGEWFEFVAGLGSSLPVVTETDSIYEARSGNLELRRRSLGVPHNQPECFIHSVASMYDNVARALFGRENAHGEVMGLAAFGDEGATLSAEDLVTVADDNVVFRNSWQHRVPGEMSFADKSGLARACQQATVGAVLAEARGARELCGSENLVLAGGVFLNINANSAIAASGLFKEVFVPSAPHDAGIAVGCAYWGDRRAGRRSGMRQLNDRLGPRHGPARVPEALDEAGDFVRWHHESLDQLASRLERGEVVARCSGRSEFGPRALGGRSLLASPLVPETKTRLNQIKGREPWRPVAPIVPSHRLEEFFGGPPHSPFMSFAHLLRPEHVDALPALSHPDGTTRVQTLDHEADPELFELLQVFGETTGYPVMVNTSLNGKGEPIVESPEDAIAFFLLHEDVDLLLLEDFAVQRLRPWESTKLEARVVRLAPGCVLSSLHLDSGSRTVLSLRSFSMAPSSPVGRALSALADGESCPLGELRAGVKEHPDVDSRKQADRELFQLVATGVLATVSS